MKYIFIMVFILLNSIADHPEAKTSCNNEVNRVFEDNAKEFKEKFNLDFSRTATDNGETVKRISVYFNYPKTIKPEEARKFLPDLLNLSLEKINQDPQLQKYLFEPPLRRENLHITIYIPTRFLSFGSCAIIGWDNKTFSFMMNDGKATIKKESYDEVLQQIH